MNEKRGSESRATTAARRGAGAPPGAIDRLREGAVGGKDHTANPAGPPEARTPVDVGSKPTITTAPGSLKTIVSEELTGRYRPGKSFDARPEEHVGNEPRGVGISQQPLTRNPSI
jgi:hypothetical protein